MSSEADENPWSSHTIEFEIVGARIVATIGHDGGAIVENVPRLFCYEGRLYTCESRRDGWLHSLEYKFGFSAVNDSDPLPSKAVEARIVVVGHHANGHRIEIRGSGWIGYDQGGNVEGRFDDPPVIITDDCDPEVEDEEEPEVERRSSCDFPMPPQFNQADVRIPARPWDFLDDE